MGERKRIDLKPGEPFTVECDGQRYKWTECYKLAEIAFMPANIFDSVLKTADGKYIRLVVVSDDEDFGPFGVSKGWYSAYSLDEAQAMKWRQAWSILREQPPLPSGPWA